MRNSEELHDKEWNWVAQVYRATPTTQIDVDAFVDKLMSEVETPAHAIASPTASAVPARQSSRSAASLKELPTEFQPEFQPEFQTQPRSQTFNVPRVLWGWFGVALIVVFAGGLWLGRTTTPDSQIANVAPQSSELALETNSNQTNPTQNPGSLPGLSSASANRTVQFVLSAPRASRVTLVGDFNGWDVDATPMDSRPGSGLWTVSIPLPDGRHVYAFVVDGDEWIADPAAPQVAVDAFGSQNSVVIVGGSI